MLEGTLSNLVIVDLNNREISLKVFEDSEILIHVVDDTV
jgi:hypothetical protein